MQERETMSTKDNGKNQLRFEAAGLRVNNESERCQYEFVREQWEIAGICYVMDARKNSK